MRMAYVARAFYFNDVFQIGGTMIALITGDRSLAILVRLRYGVNAAMHSKELWGSKFLSVVSGEGCLSSDLHGEGGQ
jgi:hypothetical protein